jgi:hypothetical protein
VWITISVVTAIAVTVGAIALVLNLPKGSSSNAPPNALVGVAASTSGGDVWMWDAEGEVYYYGNNRWAPVPGTGPDNTMIRAIAVIPGTRDAVAVGAGGAIFKLKGSNATKIESGTNRDLSDVSLDSATDGWAVGEIFVHLHSDGTTWSAQPVDGGQSLGSVSMVSATEGWAAGSEGGAAALMHFDGSSWSSVAVPSDYYYTYGIFGFSGIAAPARGEVWAVAGENRDYILHYHNGAWDQPYALWDPTQYDVQASTVTLNRIRMTSPSEGWAVGSYTPSSTLTPLMWQYTGGRWSQVTSLPTLTVNAELTDCAMASATDGWVVGKTQYTHYSASLVLHESRGKWTTLVQQG